MKLGKLLKLHTIDIKSRFCWHMINYAKDRTVNGTKVSYLPYTTNNEINLVIGDTLTTVLFIPILNQTGNVCNAVNLLNKFNG